MKKNLEQNTSLVSYINMLDRRAFLGLGVGAAAAALAACTTTPAATPIPKPAAPSAPKVAPATAAFQGASIDAVIGSFMGQAPWIIAHDLGFFEDESIDIDLAWGILGGSSSWIQLLSGNQIQLTITSIGGALLNALDRGAEITAVAGSVTFHRDFGAASLLVSDKLWNEGVQKTEDVKGRKVGLGFPLGSASDWVVNEAFRQAGINYQTDVERVQFSDTSVLRDAFIGGTMDIVFLGEPQRTTLINEGGHVLVGDEVLHGMTGVVALMRNDWIEANNEGAVAVLKAYLRGVRRYSSAQKDGWKMDKEVADVLMERLKMTEEILFQTRGEYTPDDGAINIDAVRAQMEYQKALGLIEAPKPTEQWIDLSFVEEANRRLAM